MELPEGDFTLVELSAPRGFQLDERPIPVKIKSGETTERVIINKPVKENEPAPTPKPEDKPGRLVVVKEAEGNRNRLAGAVFGLFDAETNHKITELTTDAGGRAELEIRAGEFYLRELQSPTGFRLSSERIPFKVNSGKITELTVVNKPLPVTTTPEPTPTPTPIPTPTPTPTPEQSPTPPIQTPPTQTPPAQTPPASATQKPDSGEPAQQGTLRLVKKAAGTGVPLPGAVFGVFERATDRKITEVTTGSDGTAVLPLTSGDFYLRELRAPHGYILETARIPFTIRAGAVTLAEVTNERDWNIDLDEADTPLGEIVIPKTGTDYPMLNIILAGLCFAAAAVCSVILIQKARRPRQNHRRRQTRTTP
jgi:uncharacterized surface anchored protein